MPATLRYRRATDTASPTALASSQCLRAECSWVNTVREGKTNPRRMFARGLTCMTRPLTMSISPRSLLSITRAGVSRVPDHFQSALGKPHSTDLLGTRRWVWRTHIYSLHTYTHTYIHILTRTSSICMRIGCIWCGVCSRRRAVSGAYLDRRGEERSRKVHAHLLWNLCQQLEIISQTAPAGGAVWVADIGYIFRFFYFYFWV